MKRALVLGATGHIGAHVVRALLAKGYVVCAAYRNPKYLSVLDGLSVKTVQMDLGDSAPLQRAVDGCEWVFHCAGYYPRFMDRRAHAIQQGLVQIRQVFDILRTSRIERVVYTSSTATIAPVSGRLATEADIESWPLVHWRPLYATVKIAMEHEVLRYAREGLPVVIVNPSVCVGEYDARPFSGRLVLLFAKGRLPVYLEHHFNAIYTGDVGVGHVLAAERGRLNERYLLSERHITLGEWARLVAAAAGVRPPRWRIPYPLAIAASTAAELAATVMRTEPLFPLRAVQQARQGQRLDGSRARRELGMPHTLLEDAIRLALAWFKRHGYL